MRATVVVGNTVTFSVTTQSFDKQPIASVVLLINGNVVPLSATGTATLSSVTPGVFTVTAKGFDAEGNEGDAIATVDLLQQVEDNGLGAFIEVAGRLVGQ